MSIKRFKFLRIFIIFSFFILLTRLFYWQVVKGSDLSQIARRQHKSSQSINSLRGEILASDGTLMVGRGLAWTIYANPQEIIDHEKIANIIVKNLYKDIDKNGLYRKTLELEANLAKNDLRWVPLARRVDNDIKKNIEELEIDGIGFQEEEIRYYPEASAAAHLLGFLGKDNDGNNIGYFGLEGYYEDSLSGKKGFLTRDSDAGGRPIIFGEYKKIGALDGITLLTTIDKTVQISIEKHLKEGIEKYEAKAGTVIVMEPTSGKILAMTSYPSFDPNEYYKFSDELFINPAISSSFEPGSVFKIIVMASALDAGVVDMETKCDICAGPLKIDKYNIETWDKKYYKDSNMTDIIVHSDNVGMSFVGLKLGKDKIRNYLSRFGLGEITGIDLQGEVSPRLRSEKDWKEIDTVTASFGQGIALTPLQMITAASVIANDGVLNTPRVVDQFLGNGWKKKINNSEGKRIISKKASDLTTLMMVEAAKRGESKWTYKKGYGVAGKTGTAQIPISGHYDEEKTIASFIGFAPYDNPKYIMLVTLREPGSSIWASETAAPLWYKISEDLFLHFNIMPKNE